jgi:hypothetical protein
MPKDKLLLGFSLLTCDSLRFGLLFVGLGSGCRVAGTHVASGIPAIALELEIRSTNQALSLRSTAFLGANSERIFYDSLLYFFDVPFGALIVIDR